MTKDLEKKYQNLNKKRRYELLNKQSDEFYHSSVLILFYISPTSKNKPIQAINHLSRVLFWPLRVYLNLRTSP